MSKIIALFPGQGSQAIGMGQELANTLPAAQALLTQADQILGFSLSKIMFEGPEEELKKTENTQPALFVVSAMALEVLKAKNVKYDYVAGHSLGEYSALYAAGAISFEQGLKLVRLRGELMAQAGEKAPGAMSAVLNLADDLLASCLEQSQDVGAVVAANYNCPGQVVISGDVAAVAKAGELCTQAGAKVVALPVSGAFHSPLMAFAQDGLSEGLQAAIFNAEFTPLIANVIADVVTDASTAKDLLVKQLTGSVRWTESMNKALELGVTQAYEIGSGKVLMGLMRKITRDIKVTPVSRLEDIAE
jgi:[acyl-carrier-protein] S-malonyltransferase